MINISGLEFAHSGSRRTGVAGRVRLPTASVTLIDRTTVVLFHEPLPGGRRGLAETARGYRPWARGGPPIGFMAAMRDFKIVAANHDGSSSDHIPA